MTYRTVTAENNTFHVIWKGNLTAPVCACNDIRDAHRITAALNLLQRLLDSGLTPNDITDMIKEIK
ncbi:hypothetical protein EGM51_10745 [Verrucomicrobia bacterium S94]|nr:hypothetical protein EGM51_10745 [Verrucomicrobia bacterium S94]